MYLVTRGIETEGKVVVAVSPMLYATYTVWPSAHVRQRDPSRGAQEQLGSQGSPQTLDVLRQSCGCAMPRISAARLKCSSLATTRNVRRKRVSISIWKSY